MKILFEFLNQPIILTIITLTIGGYLFSILNDRRARRDKTREKAIELLEEAGDDLNLVFSRLFEVVRFGQFPVAEDSPLQQERRTLFVKRFSVMLKSKAYLKSKRFWSQYDQLVWEIEKIVLFVSKNSDDHDLAQTITEIQSRRKHLTEKWALQDESLDESLNIAETTVSDELLSWANMLWKRAIFLLSTALQDALK
jgi:hypothetical protein